MGRYHINRHKKNLGRVGPSKAVKRKSRYFLFHIGVASEHRVGVHPAPGHEHHHDDVHEQAFALLEKRSHRLNAFHIRLLRAFRTWRADLDHKIRHVRDRAVWINGDQRHFGADFFRFARVVDQAFRRTRAAATTSSPPLAMLGVHVSPTT